jgi:hypothetical protein
MTLSLEPKNKQGNSQNNFKKKQAKGIDPIFSFAY